MSNIWRKLQRKRKRSLRIYEQAKNAEPLPMLLERGGRFDSFYHTDIARLTILRSQQMQAANMDIKKDDAKR